MSSEVAVIIPFFNEENCLRHSVESVVTQSLEDIHIILVDDASTDASNSIAQKLIQEYPKKKIDLVVHETNQGLGPARNSGLNQTQAMHIMFLDADDWLINSDSVSVALLSIKENQSDLTVFNHVLAYEDGTITENPTKHQLSMAASYPTNSVQTKLHILRNHHVAWNKLYTRSILEKTKGYPSGSYEDIPVTYSCIMHANNISIVVQPLLCYRQRKGTKTRESQIKPNRVKHFDVFKRYDLVFQVAEKNNVNSTISAEMYSRMLFQFVSTYHAKGRIPKNKRSEFFSLMKQYAAKYRRFKGKPSSFREHCIRIFIACNLWRTSFLFFRLYSKIKNV